MDFKIFIASVDNPNDFDYSKINGIVFNKLNIKDIILIKKKEEITDKQIEIELLSFLDRLQSQILFFNDKIKYYDDFFKNRKLIILLNYWIYHHNKFIIVYDILLNWLSNIIEIYKKINKTYIDLQIIKKNFNWWIQRKRNKILF